MSRLEGKLDAATRELEETPQALTLAGPERSGDIPKGLLPLLEQAVRERGPLSLLYRSLWSRQRTWRGLDPYAVFHRENTWYLVGHCHLRNEPRTFRLDRIAEARRLGGAFERPAFDLDAFLRETWGVYRGRTLHEVVVHFDASLAPLIQQGAHHPRRAHREAGQRRAAVPRRHLAPRRGRPLESWASPAPPRPCSRPPWSHGSPRSQVRRTNGTARTEPQPTTGPQPQRDLPGLPTTGDEPSRQRDLI